MFVEAYSFFSDIFRWQCGTVRGEFAAEKMPSVILKCLATVTKVPCEKVLL